MMPDIDALVARLCDKRYDGAWYMRQDAVAALTALSDEIAVLKEREHAQIIAAYCAGALDVHNNWQEDRDPDFKEAAYDYASDALTDKAGS